MSSNYHHKKCRSHGGDCSRRNLVRVNANKHYHWHAMFGNRLTRDIVDEINRLWIDPDYRLEVVTLVRR